MDQITSIFRHRGEKIDQFLSHEVELARRGIGEIYDDNSVIIRPTVISYEPNVALNGALQLGDKGADDFEATFSKVEVNSKQLLVVYCALKHGLERKRKNPIFRNFHEALGDLALQAIENKLIRNDGDPHQVETNLIGYAAARFSRLRAGSFASTKSERERLPALVVNAALVQPKHNVTRYKKERDKTMWYFGLSIPKLDKPLTEIIMAARRPN